MRTSQKVLRLSQNKQGRDFVVGDIHFKTIDLLKGLKALGFDSTVDRVIAVGDLIDRGPSVLDGLRLLGEPWFFTVKGNHEQMLIEAYRQDPHARYSAHGAGWWPTIADESKEMIIQKLESLPTVIEIDSPKGIVGVVHAQVPAGCHGRSSLMVWITLRSKKLRSGDGAGSRSTFVRACLEHGGFAPDILGYLRRCAWETYWLWIALAVAMARSGSTVCSTIGCMLRGVRSLWIRLRCCQSSWLSLS